ncbi:MAG: TIGR04283 family arsenosugar biosynthesis glycosyltransferase [Gammaproteobacteria bacterium]
MKPTLSIIVPVLNEARGIADSLRALDQLRKKNCEVIVADGGSRDETLSISEPLADKTIAAPRGRARQMNAGAALARANILLFLHADTFLPDGALEAIREGVEQGYRWGRFDVELAGNHPMLKVVAWMMNRRSRLTGIATGDQAIFIDRAAFKKIGGFPDIPLMEDIAVSRKLKRLGKPYCIAAKASTSGRRWENDGVLSTILLMWLLRLAYFLGAEPEKLAQIYSRGLIWKR